MWEEQLHEIHSVESIWSPIVVFTEEGQGGQWQACGEGKWLKLGGGAACA